MKTIRHIVYSLLVYGLLTSNVPAGTTQEMSEPARLAVKSLLLDITRAGDRLVAVGERGHVLLSDDQGKNWRQIIVPTRSQLTAVYFVDADHGWAVGHDAVILHTADGGEHWSLQHRDEQYDDPLLDIWFKDPQHGFAIGAYGMFLSTDNGGRTWDRRQISEDDFHLNAITELPDGELIMAAEQGHIYHSTDGGYKWEELASPYAGSWFGIIAIDNNGLLVFGLRGHLYRSNNRGKQWHKVVSGTEASLMAAARVKTDTVVVVGLGGTVLVSHDQGASFTPRIRPDRKALTGVVAGKNGTLIMTGAGGITLEHIDP